MASVRMSNALRETIIDNAERLFNKSEIKARNKMPEDLADRIMDDIYETHYGPYMEYIKKIPDDWVHTEINGINLSIKGEVDGEIKAHHISKGSTVKNYRIPRQSSRILDYGDNYCKENHEISKPLWDELCKYHARLQKIYNERSLFVGELRATVGRCNTLKQFIDIWPHAEELIDVEYLNKLKEPVERREKVEIDTDVSTEINSILVKRTIMNSRD